MKLHPPSALRLCADGGRFAAGISRDSIKGLEKKGMLPAWTF
jgi:hypothetical protein